MERLPADLLARLFAKFHLDVTLTVLPRVCKRWNVMIRQKLCVKVRLLRPLFVSPFFRLPFANHEPLPFAMHDRRELSTRDMLHFRHGGNDAELEAVFRFLKQHDQPSHLETLCLHERQPFSPRCVNSIITHLLSPSFSRLRNLLVCWPHYSAIAELPSLEKLTVEFLLVELHRGHLETHFQSYDPWVLPKNGCLQTLVVRFEDRLQSNRTAQHSDEPREYECVPRVNLPTDGSARNLLRFSLDGSLSLLGTQDFASVTPDLEEMELRGIGIATTELKIVFPSKLKRLTFLVRKCYNFRDFPIDWTTLNHLEELTVLHQAFQSPESSWHNPLPLVPWPLDSLLSLPQSLGSLRIYSADHKHVWETLYSEFLVKLATTLKFPNLCALDLHAIPMTLHIASLLEKAYSQAEVTYRLREYPSPAPRTNPQATPYIYDLPTLPSIHQAEYHSPFEIGALVECPLCSSMVGEKALEDHLGEVCENRVRKCLLRAFGCQFEASLPEFRKHVIECSFHTVGCVECFEEMHVGQYASHMTKHHNVLFEVPPERLSLPYYQTEEEHIVKCHACEVELESSRELLKHECKEKRVLLPCFLDRSQSKVYSRMSIICE